MVQGDIARTFIAEQAGLATARLVVVADDEVERVHQIASIARAANPQATVLVRVVSVAEATELQTGGLVDHVVADDGAAVDALISHVLGTFAVPERLIEVVTQSALGTVDTPSDGSMIDPDAIVHSHVENGCEHVATVRPVRPSAPGCEECLADGSEWVHLRICLDCGHVGCCDSSPHRHARAHHDQTGHPMIRSAEPGENWAYCFVDRLTLDVEDADATDPA